MPFNIKKLTKPYIIAPAVITAATAGVVFIDSFQKEPWECEHPSIKGNISMDGGEKIYHKQSDLYYGKTEIDEDAGERYFCTEKDAEDAGWRHSKI